MLQDVERGRKTEIDTITGAVIEEGRRLGIPTPHNQTLYWLIRGLEETLAEPLAVHP
jgi:2-dehydropantoate 2-reductase